MHEFIIGLILVAVFGVICCLILFHPKREKHLVGNVEVVEADGKYAVRQYGYWKLGVDKLTFESYALDVLGQFYKKPDWYWFDENMYLRFQPQPMTLDEAKKVSTLLKESYSKFLAEKTEKEKRISDQIKINNAFKNGKVIKDL